MPVQPTYPGVYIEEIPSGVHTILGVATSITAFLGRTERGEANKAVTLTSFGDYERSFGPLSPAYPVSYTVRDFYDNGGSQAIIVRLFKDAAQDAAAQTAAAAVNSASATPAGVAQDAANKAATFTEDPAKSAAKAVSDAAAAKAGEMGATADSVRTAAQTAADAVQEASTGEFTVNANLKLKANGPGVWGNKLLVVFDQTGINSSVAARYGLPTSDLLFNISIYDGRNGEKVSDLFKRSPDERIPNVSIWDGAGERRIDHVLESQSSLIRYSGALQTNQANANYTNAVSGFTAPNPANPPAQFTGGRASLALAGQDDYVGSEMKKTGMHALDDADLFNILCIPPDLRGSDTPKEVYDKALDYCVQRRAVLIVDPPAAWNNRVALLSAPADKLANDINLSGEKARNAFLYYPRVKMSDPKRGGQYDVFAACGIIAGVFARTDTQRGVWKAPAGLDASLGGVFLEVTLTDRENGILNPLGINCLRAFPVGGKVVWGARTLRGADQLADEYKYLPVRRTALFIEESLYRGTQWVVFQPNDEPLWAQIRLNIGSFMNDLFRKGAFQGSRPQDAYFVRCDHSTTTQNDIDRGVVNIVVGFAPLKPAEFVIIQLQQIAGQIQV
jgi:phage tail sheath protein FI